MKSEVFVKIKIWIGVTLMNYTYTLACLSEKSTFGKLLCEIHRFFLSVFNISFYPVESTNSYKSKYDSCDITTIKPNRKGYTSELAFEINKANLILEEHNLPDLNLYRFRNVMIQGDSDMIVDKQNHCVINDFCYNLDERVKFVDGLLYQTKSNLCILRDNLKHPSRSLSSGIMISGKFSKNYYHEILENLIKLTLLDDLDIPQEVPIIVDSSVKKVPAFGIILSLFTDNSQREIIYIDPKETVSFNELYTVSYVNKITPHLKDCVSSEKDYIFDVDILRQFRDRILSCKLSLNTPKRIFLTRKNTKHRNFNEEEVFKLLEPLGFEAIAPEELSFQEQLSLFNQADFIIGGTGAAFTNLLFVKRGCKALCIYPNIDGLPSIFTVLGNMNQCLMLYYRSDERRKSNNIHLDYYVDPMRFNEQLMSFIDYEW